MGHEQPSLRGSSASRCPLCPQQRPNNCSAVIGRGRPLGDILLAALALSLGSDYIVSRQGQPYPHQLELTFAASSPFVSTRGLISICPGFASSHSRQPIFDPTL